MSADPLWQVDRAFLRDELEYADMSVEVWKGWVRDFESNGKLDVELSCSRSNVVSFRSRLGAATSLAHSARLKQKEA